MFLQREFKLCLGKAKKWSTYPMRWVSGGSSTKIIQLTERNKSWCERGGGHCRSSLFPLSSRGGNLLPGPCGEHFWPPAGHTRSVPRCSAQYTQRLCPWWAALTAEGFLSSTAPHPVLFMNWLPFSMAKTSNASPTRDNLSYTMSHSVSLPSQPPPYSLLNPVAIS